MVREMSDQLLDAPNKPVDDEESDKSDDVTDDEIEPESRPVPNVQAEHVHENVQRSAMLVNNFVEDASISTVQELAGPPHYVTENEAVGNASSSHVDDEDIEDKPKDYSLQYEEND